MRADTLGGEVGEVGEVGWRWKSRVLWAPVNLHEPIGECKLGPKPNAPPPPPITLTLRFKPLHPLFSPHPIRPPLFSPSDYPPPPPHPELIRNQQQSVRCIKGRSFSQKILYYCCKVRIPIQQQQPLQRTVGSGGKPPPAPPRSPSHHTTPAGKKRM
jgi:hypothetical protein